MDDFLTHEHSDDFASEYEEQQIAIELANRDVTVERLEKIRLNLLDIRAEQLPLIKI
jgi:hypothetical protein